MTKVAWLDSPEEHDYPAATSFLSLLLHPDQVNYLVAALKTAPIETFKAKDIFRASGLPELGVTNLHVARDIKRIKSGRTLSPILLIRGSLLGQISLTIADGYHRTCAAYNLDENIEVPCKIVDISVVTKS